MQCALDVADHGCILESGPDTFHGISMAAEGTRPLARGASTLLETQELIVDGTSSFGEKLEEGESEVVDKLDSTLRHVATCPSRPSPYSASPRPCLSMAKPLSSPSPFSP